MTTFSWQAATGETVPLDGISGVSLLLPVLGLDVPPVERQIEQRVAFDGGVTFRYRVPQRRFTLGLYIDEAAVSMRTVVRWFVQPGTHGTLTASTGGVDRTLETVEYAGGLEGEYSTGTGSVTPRWFGRW